ncbi:hypothetical protein ACFLUO_05575 [Chloroflexota bacterium]
MEFTNKYIPGSSYLVDYAIEHFGAEVISVEKLPETRPPFPCLTGASNTSCEAKIQEKCTYKILAVGDDTIELNYGISDYHVDGEFSMLEAVKQEIQTGGYKLHAGKEVEWCGEKFYLLGHGSYFGYNYLLKNGDIELQIMPDARGGKPSPELRVVFRSEFLWREGEVNAYNKVIDYVNQWADIEYCQSSRVDPCVDLAMPYPDIDVKNQVVSRIRKKGLYHGGEFFNAMNDEGMTFGRKGMYHIRLYDKLRQIREKHLSHMIPVWKAHGWDGESPVTRLEGELRRDGGLTLFDKEMTFETYLKLRADIWHRMTHNYLRIIQVGSATRRENCKPIDWWQDFQSCSALFGERLGVLPYRQLRPEWQPLVKQASGCIASALARLAANVGEANAIRILGKEWGQGIPPHIIEVGLARKARFTHMS